MVFGLSTLNVNRLHNNGKKTLSWAPQATTDSGQWVGNALRFATKEEAETYLAELALVRSTRVVESSDPVNYRWENGRLVRHNCGSLDQPAPPPRVLLSRRRESSDFREQVASHHLGACAPAIGHSGA